MKYLINLLESEHLKEIVLIYLNLDPLPWNMMSLNTSIPQGTQGMLLSKTSFGSAIRTSMISKEKTPGPGAYQVQSKLSKHGPIIPKASKEYSHLDSLPV